MDPRDIFDRRARRHSRDRAVRRFADHDFLRTFMIEELTARLDLVTRPFGHALELGAQDGRLSDALRARGMTVRSAEPGFRAALASGGVQCDEDRLPFADACCDLIVSAGGLESVNDLPGALALARRALRPDGMFLAALVGSPSLASLKTAMLTADLALDAGAQARVHPQIELRAAGDLLTRAGFALPVADSLTLTVRYPSLLTLMRDLRGMGATNLLASRHRPLTRAWLAEASAAFALGAEHDGKTAERFEILMLTGWAPAPGQPKPARRGSGTRSLAETLGGRG